MGEFSFFSVVRSLRSGATSLHQRVLFLHSPGLIICVAESMGVDGSSRVAARCLFENTSGLFVDNSP